MAQQALPERINPDAILEALVEFRLEHSEAPEVVIGRLLDVELWAGYGQARLPTADIPQPIREVDPNLRYQPIFELRKADGSRVVKLGPNVCSFHITNSYPGWGVFEPEIRGVLEILIKKLKSPRISRIGFRYINVFRPEKHYVNGLEDTNIVLKVADNDVQKSVVVNYTRSFDPTHSVTVRIATPDQVIANIEAGFSLLCDIDVNTKQGYYMNGLEEAMQWIDRAHTLEKAEFFSILPEFIIEKLISNNEEG